MACNDEAPVRKGILVFERKKRKLRCTQLERRQERALSWSLKNNKGRWKETERG
jgi:hypothetical protein